MSQNVAGIIDLSQKTAKEGESLYLTFELGEEKYGLEILSVQEIVGLMSVTRVPRTAECIRGVVNLRGKVLPVMDLRLKFGMNRVEDTRRTCIVVVRISTGQEELMMGLLVDKVSEVLAIREESVEPPPAFGTARAMHFLQGMAKTESGVIMLLNVNQVLSTEELDLVSEAV